MRVGVRLGILLVIVAIVAAAAAAWAMVALKPGRKGPEPVGRANHAVAATRFETGAR